MRLLNWTGWRRWSAFWWKYFCKFPGHVLFAYATQTPSHSLSTPALVFPSPPHQLLCLPERLPHIFWESAANTGGEDWMRKSQLRLSPPLLSMPPFTLLFTDFSWIHLAGRRLDLGVLGIMRTAGPRVAVASLWGCKPHCVMSTQRSKILNLDIFK